MDYNDAINEIMPLVRDGDKTKPFVISLDSAYGDWQVYYPDPDKAHSFTLSQRQYDPYSAKYSGADFDGGSMPYVYGKILCDRLRIEYYDYRENDRNTDEDKKRLHALMNFFEDNIDSFSQSVTDYLAGIDQPFRALDKMCPLSLATDRQDCTFNESLAADAVDYIENAVYDRLRENTDDQTPEKQEPGEYTELNKISINNSDIILSESPDTEYRYMVVENWYTEYYNNSGNNNIYTGHTNDYLEAIVEFTKRVQHNISCVQSRRGLPQRMDSVEYAELNGGDCLPGSDGVDFTEKLLVVKAEALLPEYRDAESQLVFCTHGNGARPNAKGNSIFCKELASDKTVVFYRNEIEGIADTAMLPDWARSKLAALEKARTAKREQPGDKPGKKPSLLGRLGEAKAEANANSIERKNAFNKNKSNDVRG